MSQKKIKAVWLDRRISSPGPYLSLCLSEDEFRSAVDDIGASDIPLWCRKDATTHTFDHKEGDICCIVCMRNFQGRNPIEVAGLLVHEAVHVWQKYAEYIGERYEGYEQEAYAIQSIAQELMSEFFKRQQ